MSPIPAPGRRLPRPRPGPAAQAVPLPAWVRLLVLAALGKVLFCLALLPWTPLSGGGVNLLLVTVFAATGLCLLVMGRADRRAVSLGVFYLLVSTSFTFPLLAQVGRGASGVAPLARFVGNVHVEAYQPFFFWMFVRNFPRTRRVQPRGRLFRVMVAATLVVGSALLLLNLVLAFDAAGPLTRPLTRLVGRNTPGALYWPLLYGMVVPAVFYSLRQARRAPPDERRRVWTVVAGLALGVAPIVVIGVVSSFIPPLKRYIYTPEGERTLGVLLIYPSVISLPIVTAYAVLAQRALVLSQVLRRAVQHAVVRYTLAAFALLPFVVLLAEVYARRDRSVAELLSGGNGLFLAAMTAVGAALFWLRSRVLSALDRRFFRERYDAHAIVAGLAERMRTTRSRAELAELLEGEVGRALHPRLVETLVLDPASASLAAAGGTLAPLGVASALARKLAAEAAPVEVDWRRGSGWTTRLPEPEQEWLSGADVRLLVPLTGADGGLIGALALGEKRSELPYDADDRLLLSTIAASAALTVEHRLLGAAHSPVSSAETAAHGDAPARECRGCGSVAPYGAEACERCGGAMGAAALPLVLGGKFRALERVGAGGMGVVYRGVDLALGRDIAIKTLPKMGPREARWLRKEARSMAAVSHPNLALIFGAESWHGVPMLVVEYLPGGTLADRLAKGAVPVDEALGIVAALAPALGCIHEAGILHRDIKPSNIGFAADGRPKLLDFGLARAVEAAHQAEAAPASWHSSGAAEGWQWSRAEGGLTEAGDWAGTLQYLPPEAANGESPAVSWDVWALCMVLYEAVAGKHPLAGGTPHWTMVRIAEADIPDIRELAPGVPEPLAAFLRAALHGDRRKRPRSAPELGKRLHALAGGPVPVGP